VTKLDWNIKIMFFKKNLQVNKKKIDQMDENPLKYTTKDEKGLVLITILFYLTF